METEATVILRQSGLGTAKAPSRTSRTESTAVFVGRASFQMIPVLHARARQAQADQARGDRQDERARDGETSADALGRPSGRNSEDAQREVVEALRAEARALRAESELRVAAAAAAASATRNAAASIAPVSSGNAAVDVDQTPAVQVAPARQGVVLQAMPQLDVTEPIDARSRPRSPARGRRGGVSPRTIVLALVAGASMTLSAQAVMRRPTAPQPMPTTVAARETPLPAAPAKANVPSAPPAPVMPTVVASTATTPPAPVAVEAEPPRRRLRARPASAQARPATAPKVRRTASTTWVDPFVEPASAPASTAAAAWVDPFVN